MNQYDTLKKKYAAIAAHCGSVFILTGLLTLVPLSLLFFYPHESAKAPHFLIPAAILMTLGFLLRKFMAPRAAATLNTLEGGIVVVISWAIVILFSALPFLTILGLDFSCSVFESVSGWTTTGLSVVDVTHAGELVLFWRSLIQLAGGAGLAIIMMSMLVGPIGVGIANAEGRGDQLAPQVRHSARLVLLIYGGYTIAGIIGYYATGMTWFDAANHAFAAVSTGGFSTRMENIGYWESAPVEAVSIALMIMGNLSFVTAWHLCRRQFKTVSRNGEVRLMAFLIPFSAALLFIFTTAGLYPALTKRIRVAIFEAVSALTTTGFSTVGYKPWNHFGILVLIILMLIGGGACSTAGGIKQFRVYTLLKAIFWEFRTNVSPKNKIISRPMWEGNSLINVRDNQLRPIAIFVFFYMLLFFTGSLILSACGYSMSESCFEFASAIGTVGISIGVTTPDMPRVAMWAETIAMYLGRLEFIIVFVAIAKLGRDFLVFFRGKAR